MLSRMTFGPVSDLVCRAFDLRRRAAVFCSSLSFPISCFCYGDDGLYYFTGTGETGYSTLCGTTRHRHMGHENYGA